MIMEVGCGAAGRTGHEAFVGEGLRSARVAFDLEELHHELLERTAEAPRDEGFPEGKKNNMARGEWLRWADGEWHRAESRTEPPSRRHSQRV